MLFWWIFQTNYRPCFPFVTGTSKVSRTARKRSCSIPSFASKLCSICTFIRQALKCIWHEIFYYLIWKSFPSDEEWRLFYCDSTFGCRVIQDFGLCKLDYMWRHIVDTKWCKVTKNGISLKIFLYRTETLYGCCTHHKVSWYFHCDVSMATQWASGPLHSKDKIRVFSLKKCYLLL